MAYEGLLPIIEEYKEAATAEAAAFIKLEHGIGRMASEKSISTAAQTLLAKSELTTLKARSIANLAICDTSEDPASIVSAVACKVAGVEVAVKSDEIQIKLPMLLARRRHEKRDTMYLLSIMEDAITKENIPRIQERVVIFFDQVIGPSTPIRRVCDSDNAEIGDVINVIAAKLLYDDGPEKCSTAVRIRRVDVDSTMVHIVKEPYFATVFNRVSGA